MKTDGIIYVQVPHQTKAKAFTFASPEEFTNWLREQAPDGFSYRNFTREEWMAEAHESGNDEGSDWWNKWIVPGIELFDAGADQIAELWHNECNRELIADPAKHGEEEFSALFSAVNDFNTHYSLGHDEAVRILKIGPSALHHTHQQYEAFRAIENAAATLGWWQEPSYKYQVYCDRGNGPELDGCWGSEHAIYDTEEEAEAAIEQLKEGYPDVAWLWKREEAVEDHGDYDEQCSKACLASEGL